MNHAREAYKAVSTIGGIYHTLGMGKAKVIPLPIGRWIDGGEFGFSAGKTKSRAKQVIQFATWRKVLPIPPNMTVVKIYGKHIMFENNWRLVFRQIKVIEEIKDGKGYEIYSYS